MTILASKFPLALLAVYKQVVSPYMPGRCRFTPTCSEYMAEAVTLHGGVRGLLLGFRRLGRCHPFAAGGYDPPPNPIAGTPHENPDASSAQTRISVE